MLDTLILMVTTDKKITETLKTFVRAIFGKFEGIRPGSDSTAESMTMWPLGGQGQGYISTVGGQGSKG